MGRLELPGGTAGKITFLIVYSVLWVLADLAGNSYAAGFGLSTWYVNAALDIILFLVFGWRWWPLPVLLGCVASAISSLVPVPLSVALNVPYELIYALGTKFTVDVLRVRFPLRSVRDVGAFSVVLCVAAPLLSNASIMATYGIFAAATHPWSQFAEQVLRGTAADTTAVIVLVPLITQLMSWRSSEGAGFPPLASRNFVLGTIATAATVLSAYIIGTRFDRMFLGFSFVPLAWLAITYGMRGAVIGILVTDVVATAMHAILHIPADSQIEYFGYIVASALMALLLGTFSTDRLRLIEQLERSAHFDALTGLPNADRLAQWIRDARGRAAVLAMVDVSDMRLLNEGVGRETVDRVLVEIADRIRGGLSDDYFVASVGSGEFAIAIAEDRDPDDAIARIAALLSEPFEIEGSRVVVGVAIGAVHTDAVEHPHELLSRADVAVRYAKDAPSRRLVYGPALEESRSPLLVVELHRAVENGEFVPFFQPIYRHREGRWFLAGAEVLLRWQHPQRGLLAPASFLQLLERLSICKSVGWHVLDQGLRNAARWRDVVEDFTIWVNLFPLQALDPDCSDRIRSAIEATRSLPQSLVVEITERVVVNAEQEVVDLARKLRSFGSSMAIDDFGTGGSSLARIREVPAQILKIDKSFVNRSEVDSKAMAVASAVARLASELGMSVVAEGAESWLQVKSMAEIGCDYCQGYALGHPAPVELFERFVTREALDERAAETAAGRASPIIVQ